eukprot:364539-Chlamydomonas_euryale.AAC.12
MDKEAASAEVVVGIGIACALLRACANAGSGQVLAGAVQRGGAARGPVQRDGSGRDSLGAAAGARAPSVRQRGRGARGGGGPRCSGVAAAGRVADRAERHPVRCGVVGGQQPGGASGARGRRHGAGAAAGQARDDRPPGACVPAAAQGLVPRRAAQRHQQAGPGVGAGVGADTWGAGGLKPLLQGEVSGLAPCMGAGKGKGFLTPVAAVTLFLDLHLDLGGGGRAGSSRSCKVRLFLDLHPASPEGGERKGGRVSESRGCLEFVFGLAHCHQRASPRRQLPRGRKADRGGRRAA